MRASISAAGIAAVLVGTVFALPANATTPALHFTLIQYDSPGKDTRTNTSLNGEYVTIHNSGHSSVSLTHWTVRDAAGHRYTFGSFSLRSGASVRVHTGHGTNTSTSRYWGSGNYIWNNDGDTAYLRTPAGHTHDSCRWTHEGSGHIYC
jgi:lamin tail-like protein